jgi:hypothetical protein
MFGKVNFLYVWWQYVGTAYLLNLSTKWGSRIQLHVPHTLPWRKTLRHISFPLNQHQFRPVHPQASVFLAGNIHCSVALS